MPRETPLGSGLAHSGLSAAKRNTLLRRAGASGLFSFGLVKSGILRSSPMRRRRNSSGSAPAATASSSTNDSTTKPLLEASTERNQARGRDDFASVYSTR